MFSNKDYNPHCGYTFEAQKAINEAFKAEIAIRGSESNRLTDRSIVSWIDPLSGCFHRESVKSFTKWVLESGYLTKECERISEHPFFENTSLECYNITVFQNLVWQLRVCH